MWHTCTISRIQACCTFMLAIFSMKSIGCLLCDSEIMIIAAHLKIGTYYSSFGIFRIITRYTILTRVFIGELGRKAFKPHMATVRCERRYLQYKHAVLAIFENIIYRLVRCDRLGVVAIPRTYFSFGTQLYIHDGVFCRLV